MKANIVSKFIQISSIAFPIHRPNMRVHPSPGPGVLGLGVLPTRAPKKIEKNSLFFISVDEFSKLICCFLFSLIFSTNSTNQRNQRNEFNESTNKIFVDFSKFSTNFNKFQRTLVVFPSFFRKDFRFVGNFD